MVNEIAKFLKFKSDWGDDLLGTTAAELWVLVEQRRCLVEHEIIYFICRHQRMEVTTSQMHFGESMNTYEISPSKPPH